MLSQAALLRSRRLWPLTLAQACGALNDNLVKSAMLVMALFRLHLGGAGLSALAGALFIVPYVLLSATAGTLADRYAKPRLAAVYKLAECLLMAGAAASFLTESVPGLLAVLFGLGCQAALFGPVKYGVLPEYLAAEELLSGNGVVEATTFLSIVAGTVAGGALMLLEDGPVTVGAVGLALAVLGLWAASCMPPLPPADPSLRIRANIFADTGTILLSGLRSPGIGRSVLFVSWFWTMGATILTELPIVTRDVLQAEPSVLTALLTVFAVGVGVGSIGCASLLGNRVSTRFAPFSALGISLFLWDFSRARPESIATLRDLLGSVAGWHVLSDLGSLAACGGMFSLPFYALIQQRSPPSRRSRMIACNNIMNALFMVAGAAATAALAAAGLDAMRVLTMAALANLLVAGLLSWRVLSRRRR